MMLVCLPAVARAECMARAGKVEQPEYDVASPESAARLPFWAHPSFVKLGDESDDGVITLEGGFLSTQRHPGSVRTHVQLTPGSPFSVVAGITIFF